MRSTALLVLLFAACTSEVDGSEEADGSGVATDTFDSAGTAAAGAAWDNTAIPGHTGVFHVVLAAVPGEPSGAPIDAVIGLSSGPAARFSDLAAIVRFSPSGVLDVRNGSTYEADTAFPYRIGDTYQIRFEVDLLQRRYSVLVQHGGGTTTKIAHRYAFRTEQATLSKIDNLGVFLDSPTGAVRTYGVEAND
jgi:hypothetical protein